MKPEYVGVGNFDEDNYVYAYCNCPFTADYAIKWPRIKDGKVHSYICTCEDCGTEVGIVSKSYGLEMHEEKSEDCVGLQTILNNLKFSVTNKKGTGMTREEAIKELSYILDEMPSMECADWIEALVMGIKALQQEPCDDAISRNKALTINDLCNGNWAVAHTMLKAEPPVTLQPKMGHWITKRTIMHDGEFYCDVCNNDAPFNKTFRFCPNCGAMMQEVQNETDN